MRSSLVGQPQHANDESIPELLNSFIFIANESGHPTNYWGQTTKEKE